MLIYAKATARSYTLVFIAATCVLGWSMLSLFKFGLVWLALVMIYIL